MAKDTHIYLLKNKYLKVSDQILTRLFDDPISDISRVTWEKLGKIILKLLIIVFKRRIAHFSVTRFRFLYCHNISIEPSFL